MATASEGGGFRRFKRQPRESTSTYTSNLQSSCTPIISNEGFSSCSNGSDVAAQTNTTTELEEKKQQIASAKRLFKKLARSYLDKRAPPDPERVRELWEYKDILDLKTVFAWRDEVGIRRGVLYEDGKVEFEEWPNPPHEDIIDLFEIIFRRQFINPWPNDLNPTFSGKHSQDTNFPGKKKQPDSAFMPYPRPNPNNLLANLIQLQPILRRPWPTIVLEVGNSEPATRLIEHRDKYLGHTTQVNVYVSVFYNRNQSRQMDSWWVCVAHRDINAPQPPPGTPPQYPAPIIIDELQKTPGNRLPNVNQPIPANASIWSVPTALLFHPEPIPVRDPPFPPSFDIDIEVFRQIIIRERLPWFLSFIILNLIVLEIGPFVKKLSRLPRKH